MSATPSAANAKVLVIDDDKDLRYSLRRALAGLGHTVIEADSGETGVVAAKLMFVIGRFSGWILPYQTCNQIFFSLTVI